MMSKMFTNDTSGPFKGWSKVTSRLDTCGYVTFGNENKSTFK
jgi:hypothetical protein